MNHIYSNEELLAITGISSSDESICELEKIKITEITHIDYFKEQLNIFSNECETINSMLHRLKIGGQLPAIKLHSDKSLADGSHRLAAHLLFGNTEIWALIKIKNE